MKLRKLEKHLRRHCCRVDPEGGSHTIWVNLFNGRVQAVPRHKEIQHNTARSICRALEIPVPEGES
ncbi:type II toxin-antitoxin system HicA family toxin [Phycisphaera mikurensis]|uniref:Addiction module toxin, HicA family n=1 Tax=Phycisphaera mikurensis (strain NBRC 102666 / KCTC 22515 / FYK2301M01) TaxID=1142394 RepID=I0IA97_PHYMF|nr:type II toxin-antitoxin system HicA family toxin [Phycisphaera mikurensis]MBB6441815.1 putative RNA binding protein YcfA (HicA-like mRNA interferase family) [Phycisphaera mikurensis]BAM02185.1 hypothetical protein PSMK_00260 [Phycisphaera mikurensis NBRC 102666]